MNNHIELLFNDFVQTFGGDLVTSLLPAGVDRTPNADYVFRQTSPAIIAELKCLTQSALPQDYNLHMKELTEDWRRRGLVLVYGTNKLELRSVPQECQREWLRLVEPSLKHILAKANKQIKTTKDTLDLATASGVLLLMNEGNFDLHPYALMTLIRRILQRRKDNGERIYSSIGWIVYFAIRVAISVPGTPELFTGSWFPATTGHQADSQMKEFLNRMKIACFEYFAKREGAQAQEKWIDAETLERLRQLQPVKW